MRINTLLMVFIVTISHQAFALDSDQDQPATLEADDFELDLKTGVRTYRGNVLYRQGSIRLECDELVTFFNSDGELDKALCTGDPGKFKQRPEGSEDDMLGQAREITLDQVEELVVLKSRADVKQGGTRLTGRLLTYDLKTEKVRVKGGQSAPATTTAKKADPGSAQGTASTAAESDTESTEAPVRPTIVIQPRKKKKN